MLDRLYALLANGPMTRDDILTQVYGVRIGRHSKRYVQAHQVRLQRLVDRARRRARRAGVEVHFDRWSCAWRLINPNT